MSQFWDLKLLESFDAHFSCLAVGCCHENHLACGCCMFVLCMLQTRNTSKYDSQSEASQETDIDLDVKKTLDVEGLYAYGSLILFEGSTMKAFKPPLAIVL